jgi:dTDP-4-dehydrorhamnose reductase
MSENSAPILILGCDGLVGRTVFHYLHEKLPGRVFGTQRSAPAKIENIFSLSVDSFQSDYTAIKNVIGTPDFVINCIGCTKQDAPIDDLEKINAVFPKLVESTTSASSTKLIYISSDAVFSETSDYVVETTPPNPTTPYGRSKMHGETTAAHCLTIRTSFLGFHSEKNTGLLEWLRRTDAPVVNGYTNQNWSGCTTYQFAQLCEFLIAAENFSDLRSQTPVLHFAPLSASKATILETTCRILNLPKKIKKVELRPLSRTLKTLYSSNTTFRTTNDLTEALRETWKFEQLQITGNNYEKN